MARILIIDDDPDTRLMLEEILKSACHQTVTAADGKEGVKQYLANPADLVITDIFMPDQDGFQTITELRKQFPSVSIIAISGKDSVVGILSIARTLGAVGVLQKPFTPAQLLTAADNALRSKPPGT
jgi:DNA-binding response OmpR family regulator